MRLRSIRARVLVLIIIPLLSLIGVYAFATTITASDAIKVVRATSIRAKIAVPIGFLSAQVQAERLIATMYLAAPTPQYLEALSAQETKTNKVVSAAEAALRSESSSNSSSSKLKADITIVLRRLAALPRLRQGVRSRTLSMTHAQNGYSAIVAAGYNTILQTAYEVPNAGLATQSITFMRIAQGEELLLQEQALLVGDVTAGSFPAAAHARFTKLVGEHRWLIAASLPELLPQFRAVYRHAVSPSATVTLTALENAVADSPPGSVPRVSLTAYQQAATAVARGLAYASYTAGSADVTVWHNVGRSVVLQLVIAGGAGLIAIIISIIISIWIGRGLVGELGGLKRAALDLANVRLPEVVRRLSTAEGPDVDVAVEAPFAEPTSDEIGQLRRAFNSVQETAIEAAVGQAKLRAGIATIFRNLARRSQSLLHRQLAMLDDMELRASEPEELESLFQLDHLTTRMRRNAEGLVVLAGDRPGRGWNKPVPFADVLRASVAEVEDYRRVRVITKSRAALAGRAVADVIHLVAELVENALIFSPPNTPVRVVGDRVARGFAVEIEDRGLGILPDTMAEINAKLADPPIMDPAATEQLGLYVAGQLASQHRIRVSLRDSPFGGTNAIVLVPDELVVSEESYSADAAAGLANDLAIKVTGRHAVRSGRWISPPADAGDVNSGRASAPELVERYWGNGSEPSATADEGSEPSAAAAEEYQAEPVFDEAPGTAEPQSEAVPPPEAPGDAISETGLPRRIRQASLAPQLRDPQQHDAGGSGLTGGDHFPERSPGDIRDRFSALQSGWERARAESSATWPDAGAGPPATGGAPGGEQGGTPSPGPSQEDTT
jgi:methyl-accepting chemotaxis protein